MENEKKKQAGDICKRILDIECERDWSVSLGATLDGAHSPTLTVTSPTSQLILQPFRRFAYVTAHSPTFTVISSTSQLILEPFRRFTYVTAHSPALPLLHLRHSSFSSPSFASPTSQALHLIQLASRP